MASGISCSLLPTKMRELAAEWKSSGSIATFNFGGGPVTASNIATDVQLQGGSVDVRKDGLSLDYQTAWAFGPIETGSLVSGSVAATWRIRNVYTQSSQSGSVFLDRENDAQDNWRTGSLLFQYTGSAVKEIDLTFDQSGRPVVCGDRNIILGGITSSIVYLYRFITALSDFDFTPVATGSSPRVLLDDPVDTINNDVLLFYVQSITSENVLVSGTLILTSGSGTSDVASASLCAGLTMSLTPYKVSRPAFNEVGFFTSATGTGASIAITGSFSTPVSAVGARIVDPDFDPSEIIAFDITGSEIGRKLFVSDGVPGVETKDTQVVKADAEIISSFLLTAAPADYVGYDYILVVTSASCGTTTFSDQTVYFRQQRENYATERVVPLVNESFDETFLYELFLEDVVKLTDNRLALYISRRNMDSGSGQLGEYRTDKFETILFPQRVAEDEWSASVDLVSGTLTPQIQYSNFDIEFFQSMSAISFPSGSSSLREALIDHSNFDVELFHSMSAIFFPSGSSSLFEVLITHSVFDKDSYVSYSMGIQQATSSLAELVVPHTAFDKDSYVSYSMDILSGSLE